MASKLKHYIVTIEKTTTYEVNVDSTSEEKAMKLAEKEVKNDTIDPADEITEVTDIYEDFSDED